MPSAEALVLAIFMLSVAGDASAQEPHPEERHEIEVNTVAESDEQPGQAELHQSPGLRAGRQVSNQEGERSQEEGGRGGVEELAARIGDRSRQQRIGQGGHHRHPAASGDATRDQEREENVEDVEARIESLDRPVRIAPELEAFETGMVQTGKVLIKRGVLKEPFYFNLVLGAELSQFAITDTKVELRPEIRTEDQIHEVVEEAAEVQGLEDWWRRHPDLRPGITVLQCSGGENGK